MPLLSNLLAIAKEKTQATGAAAEVQHAEALLESVRKVA
jgi:hypothetical protein